MFYLPPFPPSPPAELNSTKLISITNSFIHNPQLPRSVTLPQYPLRAGPPLLPAVLAQMSAFDFLPAGVQDAFVLGLLFGGGVEAAVDGGVEGAAEGFADALFDGKGGVSDALRMGATAARECVK